MGIIKGPFKLERKGSVGIANVVRKFGGSLPFTAKGWRSTKNADLVKGGKPITREGIEALKKRPMKGVKTKLAKKKKVVKAKSKIKTNGAKTKKKGGR